MRIPLFFAVAFALAACSSSADEEPGAAPADSAAVAPSPAADGSATADSAAGAGTAWQVSERGAGPVLVDMSLDELRQALGGDVRVEGANAGPEACVYAQSPALPAGVRVMLVGPRVVRVEVDSGATASSAGVRIGDTEARVREAYAGREIRVQPHKYTAGSYLIVLPNAPGDTLPRLVFETDSATGAVTRFRGGIFPPVEYVEGCS
jgi:hypothetical protein